MNSTQAALVEALRNFEITGPDADGLVWLVLHGKGTNGKAMFNLGAADRFAVQVARAFEEDRRAALAQAEAAQPVAADRVRECAARLVEHADFKLGGVLSAASRARDIPSGAYSQVKARHLAALRDALAAAPQPANTAPNLACKSVQKRLATQWGYVPSEAAPKQEAVALTDEQINALHREWIAAGMSGSLAFARMVERAHGIEAAPPQQPAP